MTTRTLHHFLCAGAALLQASCIPIPLADPPPYREETIGTLEPGTERVDVLFTLGAPNFVHDEERVFVYASDEHKLGWVLILGNQTAGGVGAGSFAKRFLLVIEFDEDGRLVEHETLDLGIGMPSEELGDTGYSETVCTRWNRCFMNSGAVIVIADPAG